MVLFKLGMVGIYHLMRDHVKARVQVRALNHLFSFPPVGLWMMMSQVDTWLYRAVLAMTTLTNWCQLRIRLGGHIAEPSEE
ncbi:hypothetical protein TNCT_331481 [Trichonephila clavata]|uniref:Uncharacterized protein n=1 Tax=Trichonephila clavata TaxID=2740835 RepID=A0A8X6FJ15_TRICU|nr:hypothetical protein TNCT_331481 [Trichonephila clavata]